MSLGVRREINGDRYMLVRASLDGLQLGVMSSVYTTCSAVILQNMLVASFRVTAGLRNQYVELKD